MLRRINTPLTRGEGGLSPGKHAIDATPRQGGRCRASSCSVNSMLATHDHAQAETHH